MHVVTAFFQKAMDGFSCIVTVVSVVSLISGCDLPPVWNAAFQEAEDPIYLSLSLHIYETVDGFQYVVTGLFQKAVDVAFNMLSLHI